MSDLEWVTEVSTGVLKKRGPGALRDFLNTVVLATLNGDAEVSDDEAAANMVRYAKSPLYSSAETAAEAGRYANRNYAKVFNGRFDWFTKTEGGYGYLYIRFIPNEPGRSGAI